MSGGSILGVLALLAAAGVGGCQLISVSTAEDAPPVATCTGAAAIDFGCQARHYRELTRRDGATAALRALDANQRRNGSCAPRAISSRTGSARSRGRCTASPRWPTANRCAHRATPRGPAGRHETRRAAGNYDGFRVIRNAPGNPREIVHARCNGDQGDIVVWEDILVRSWNSKKAEERTCGGQTVPAGWEGVHVFDIGDPGAPTLVAAVELPCGSHTVTAAGVSAGNLIVYSNNSTAPTAAPPATPRPRTRSVTSWTSLPCRSQIRPPRPSCPASRSPGR